MVGRRAVPAGTCLVTVRFFHPSNTKLLTNPIYRTRGRALGSDSTGKFTQYRLEKKEEPDDMTEEDKRQTWSDRVRYIARVVAAEGRDLEWTEFLNQWSRASPNDAAK